MELALRILALLIVFGTFLPLIRNDVWLIRGWDFPRIQLLAAGLAVASLLALTGLSGLFWDWVAGGLLAMTLIFLMVNMARYTPLHPKEMAEATGESALKVLVSNVLMSNRESGPLLERIREYEPDLLVALETDRWWTDQLASLSNLLPHAVEIPQNDTYGMVLRSKSPLIDPVVRRLFRDNIPSVRCRIRLACGEEIHVHAVHPKPPFPDESSSSASRDAELLLVGKEVKKTGGPTIVLGDLNDVAWSRSTRLFQKTSGLLDPRRGRGFFNTFHAERWWMRWPLDHVFISKQFRVRRLVRLKSVGSDHFPMFADFSYEPEKPADEEPPEMDADEREEADKKIRNARSADS